MAIGRSICIFSGHVQGVGFRYTTARIADEYDVTGYVRNCSDGRVELVVEGDAREREAMLGDIQQQMGGYIDDVQKTESPATGEYTRFSIRH